MARVQRRLLEVVLAYELEDLVVEDEAAAGERGYGLGELRGVRVLRRRGGAGLLLRLAERRERRLDAEAALPLASLGGGLLRRGEGEVAYQKIGRRPRVACREIGQRPRVALQVAGAR